MDILIVEDDHFKYSKIESLLLSIIPTAQIKWFDNVHDAIVYIETNTPDKMILDMSLPSHSAKAGQGSPISMPTGGIEILLEMRYLDKHNVSTIILTQYPDIELDGEYYSIDESEPVIRQMYGVTDLVVAHYDSESDTWIKKIQRFLE